MRISGNGSLSLYDIGTLAGSSSTAAAHSGNGSVAVGWSDISGNTSSHAFRASAVNGYSILDLGTLGGSDSGANDVSQDGSVIVGWSNLADNFTDHAFRWTLADGTMHDLGTLGGSYSEATAVSGDGTVVAGISFLAGDANWHAFRWTATNNTMRDLGTLGGSDSWALCASDDSSVVVGQSDITGNAGWHVYDGYSDSGIDGDGASGVFKVLYGTSDLLRVGLGVIRAAERLELDDNGAMSNDAGIFGTLISYGSFTGDGLHCRFSLAYGSGKADLTRRYLTGSGSAASSGELGVEQYGFAMEAGYGLRVTPDTLITPFAGYERVESELDSYSETGGPFPAHFDERTLSDSYGSAGVKVKQRVLPPLDLELDGDYMLRLSGTDAPVSGSLIGLGTTGAFSQEVELSRDWLELRAGIDYAPESISKGLHLRAGFQLDLGQEFDVPVYRIDTGLVLYF